MTLYGFGSAFTAADDPADVDLLAVADDQPDLDYVRSLLPNDVRGLPLDLSVVARSELEDRTWLVAREAARRGVRLEGPDVLADIAEPHWIEWTRAMIEVTLQKLDDGKRGGAALAALSAVWGAEGKVVVGKHQTIEQAAGTRWEPLATDLWEQRHSETFDHPDLSDLFAEATVAAGGDARLAEWQQAGWSSQATMNALFTIYRGALDGGQLARLRQVPTDDEREGGWIRGYPDGLADVEQVLDACTGAANATWWRYPLAGFEEHVQVHRHPPGSTFPAHIDRVPVMPHRLFNVVAMVDPAEQGGHLELYLGDPPYRPTLDPGDVIVFDSATLHGVSEVVSGDRCVAVMHAVSGPPPDPDGIAAMFGT